MMSIVPVYPRIVRYTNPLLPMPYPVFYPHIYCYPAIEPYYFAYPAVPYQVKPCLSSGPAYEYKLINAVNNPGSFWIWPYGL